MTENFVLQQLRGQFEVEPRYFSDKNGEIDFVLQYRTEIIPVETKGGEDRSIPSFKRYASQRSRNMPYVSPSGDIGRMGASPICRCIWSGKQRNCCKTTAGIAVSIPAVALLCSYTLHPTCLYHYFVDLTFSFPNILH